MATVGTWIRLSRPLPGYRFNPWRKAWHSLGLVVPIAFHTDLLPFHHYPGREIGLYLLGFVTCALIGVDLLRFRFETVNRIFFRYFGFLLKQEERGRINATVPYFLANFVIFLFLDSEIAALACILLMVGDPFAALIGGKYGRVRFWNGKSLEGLGAFLFAGFTGCIIFLMVNTLIRGPEAPYALFGPAGIYWELFFAVLFASLAGAVSEFFSGTTMAGLVDDNLVVPLSSAAAFTLFAFILGFPADWILELPPLFR